MEKEEEREEKHKKDREQEGERQEDEEDEEEGDLELEQRNTDSVFSELSELSHDFVESVDRGARVRGKPLTPLCHSRVVGCVFPRCERLLINSEPFSVDISSDVKYQNNVDVCLLCSLQAAQTSLRRSWLSMRN